VKRRRLTRAEWDNAASRRWNELVAKVNTAQDLADARKIVPESPPLDSPGRNFYTNLAFFLDTFTPPASSNDEEKTLYIQLLRTLDKAGDLRTGERQRIEKLLVAAMSEAARMRSQDPPQSLDRRA
jgi:hypothetical protein